MTMPSNRLRIVPIDIAAKVGSEELVSLLVERNCKLNYWDGVSWGWHRTNALSVAARAGNRGALEAWIKYSTALPTNRITSSGHNRDIQPTLVRAFRAAVRVGKIEIAEFLERHGVNSNPEPEGEGELEAKWFELMLCDAVELGNIKIVRRCLGRQDAHVFGSGWTNRYGRRKWAKLKGPLWIALQDCPRHERPDIVRLLLEAGFDAHDHRPETNKTLLQCAVKDGDVESARLLVEHGADINVCGSGGPGDRHQAPLSLAVNAARTKNSNGNMVKMLLDNRAKRRWFWRGKEYVLEADAGKVVSIEKIFKDLGFDEEDMENACTDFYVIINHVL
ncbi:ankyrin repeat-containing domain protein [Aspergillus foveolatus]|uniref:ankyrin repeat-containing domain protein n=1 Tax=Aspergillus foveolatus TaxID=210207 RepID=UPI003CCD758E